MSGWRVGVAAAVLGLLSACAAGPRYRAPRPDLPDAYAAGAGPGARAAERTRAGGAAAAAAPTTLAGAAASATSSVGPPSPGGGTAAISVDLAAWWKALDDPELDSLIDRAMHSNLDIALALARLQEARTYEVVIAGRALPELDASAAGARGTGSDLARGRAQQALVSADNATGLEHINTIAGFDAVWQIDLFGKFRREIEAAHDDAQAARAARESVLTAVAADVARGYVDLRGFQMRLGVLQRARAVLEESLRIVGIRYQRGITNELDLALARRELETLDAEVRPLQAEVSAAEYALAVLVGEYPEHLVAELSKPNLIPSVPGPAAAGTPIELLKRRPDIQEAERRLAGATARIGVATANLFPQVSLVGAFGQDGQGWGQGPTVDHHIWSFGPAALWPLLDFGALDAQVDVAELQARERLLTYKKTILQAVREVDDALAGYEAQQDRLKHVGEALLAGQRAMDLATQRYDRGLTDYLNVVDAQRSYYELQDEYAAAQVSEVENFIVLYRSLGGGWQNYTEVPGIRLPQPAVVAAFRRVLADPFSAPKTDPPSIAP